ncbi:MAG: hypothetical protein KJ646_05995 [Nanoarchaeota archaeon]|nr:hypothetical protein [Nanoarchaeota archaeon]MBU4116596.1 hypothetical protein [Nanoarchaeota archaeon]
MVELINSGLRDVKRRLETRNLSIKLREEENERYMKELLKKEETFLPKRKDYFDKILEWKEEFIKTQQFKNIYESLNKTFISLIIFRGGWGHRIPYEKGYGCWSNLCLERSRNMIYEAGYKWGGATTLINLCRNEEQFSPLYLKKIFDEINDKSIYKKITSEIKKFPRS